MSEREPHHLIVAKFGGTSMAEIPNMVRSAEIVLANPLIKLVVVSATAGTTNLLLQLGEAATAGNWSQCEEILQKIESHHLGMLDDLQTLSLAHEHLQQRTKNLFQRLRDLTLGIYLLRENSPRIKDSLLSFGEQLSSEIFTLVLKNVCDRPRFQVCLFDARKVMRTDSHFGQASPLLPLIKDLCHQSLLPLLEENDVIVTQGFIGACESGETTTLGRGGSDYSAALLAEATQATCLQIWTDVSGISTMDPRVIPNAQVISEMTYTEAAELANLGAKVLHPLTLIPMMRTETPVFVGNSFRAVEGGTWILAENRLSGRQGPGHQPFIRAMAQRKSQGILTLSRIKSSESYGFLAKIFSILEKYRISVDLISTSEISTAMTLNNPDLLTEEVMSELSSFADTSWEDHFTLISLIGEDLITHAGIPALIFSSLKEFPIRFICMGSGKNNISFLIDQKFAIPALQKLHDEFLQRPQISQTQHQGHQEHSREFIH